jgi:hypothetical protein
MNAAQLTVFIEYTRRFDSIIAELPIGGTGGTSAFENTYSETKTVNSQKFRLAAMRFFNLAAEEHFLRSEGLIPEEVWKMWQKSMQELFATKLFKEVWKDTYSDSEAFKPFVAFVEESAPAK